MSIPPGTVIVEIDYEESILPIRTDFEELEAGPVAVRGTLVKRTREIGRIEDENGIGLEYSGNRFSKEKLERLEVGDLVWMGGIYMDWAGPFKTNILRVYDCGIIEK